MKGFKKNDALLIVDAQNDFFKGGALAVEAGDEIVPVLNEYLEKAMRQGIPVFASRDWHPANHCSFKVQGGLWPPHCVQGTLGAQFHAGLNLPEDVIVVSKAVAQDKDAYSAFEGKLANGEALADVLNKMGVKCLFIGGLALDYCVKATVLDAKKQGFAVNLILDAVRAIDSQSGELALNEMRKVGVEVVTVR